MQMQTVFATLSILLNKCSISLSGSGCDTPPHYFENYGKRFVFVKKFGLFFVSVDLERRFSVEFLANRLHCFGLWVR